MAIEAVVFDFGGVLVRTKTWAPRQKWDDLLGLEHGTVEFTVFNSDHGRAAQHGEMSEHAHWQWVAERFELTEAQLAELKVDFWAGDELDTRLIAFIESLRPRFKTSIISNAMDGLRPDLLSKWGIRDTFDRVVVSAAFGVMKPAPSIYEHCLHVTGVKADKAVFIDDFMHNIEGANAVGMHGIHYPPAKSTDDLIAEFAAMGVA